jgi:hypothetical protein
MSPGAVSQNLSATPGHNPDLPWGKNLNRRLIGAGIGAESDLTLSA